MKTFSTFLLALRVRSLPLFGLLVGVVFLIPALGLQAQPSKAWDKTIGGSGGERLNSLQQTSDGGYILGGRSDSNRSGDKSEDSKGEGDYGRDDYWVVKLDASGNKLWDKTLGGEGFDGLTSLQQTSDGGYILGGTSGSDMSGDKTENSKGETDSWVVKLDAAGNKVWDKTIGGSGGDGLSSLQQTSDGGYILGASSISDMSGDKTENSKGGTDYWVVKLDAAGNKLWDKTIGGSGVDYLESLQQTSDGGYILGGWSDSDMSGDKTENGRGINGYYDYWVVKLDASGNKLWDKTLGGEGFDGLTSLQQTSDGGYILGGTSDLYMSGDKTENGRGGYDYWVVKLDASGNKLWDKTLGGSEEDELYSLQQTSDGGYILGGYSGSDMSGDKTENSKGDYDYWVVKLNAAGNKLWDKTIGGKGFDAITSLQQTSDGGYILGGTSDSDMSGDKSENNKGGRDYWVVKLDAADAMRITSFTLVDADTDQDLQTLNEGDVLDLSTLPTTHLNIRANPSPATVGSVVFHLDKLPRYIQNHAPHALFGNTGNDYNAGLLLPGPHQLKATPYTDTYGKGTAGTSHRVSFTVVGSSIPGFTLVNADTDQDVMELGEGDVINYGVLGTRNINIRANTFPDRVGSVGFTLNGELIRRENILPYALGGDNYPDVDDYHAYPLPVGQHTLLATSYSGRFGSGSIVATASVSFSVVHSATAAMAATAVEESSSGFAAHPNPFTNQFTLQLGSVSKQVQVTLVDQLGRKVYQKEFTQAAGVVEIDVSGANLKDGMYFLRLTSATTGTKVVKLMKQ